MTKQRYIESLKALRNRTGAYNNWLVFTGLNESFINWAGGECDPFRLKIAKNKVREWYAGDGWYCDGPKFSMDYYNSYVLNPMYVAMLETLASKKEQVRKKWMKLWHVWYVMPNFVNVLSDRMELIRLWAVL